MDKNLDWFAKADLSEYEDEYVAIAEEKVIAHGDDPEKIYLKAKEVCGNKEVVLWKVPKGDVFIFRWRHIKCQRPVAQMPFMVRQAHHERPLFQHPPKRC